MTRYGECPHTNRALVWTTLDTDLEPMQTGKRLRQQCQDCGALLATFLAHSLATPETPELDVDAARRALEAREQKRQEQWARYQQDYRREREIADEQWWADYNTYLRTDEWWRRRSLVMKRANQVCEGCRKRRATQVHHLTYKHVRSEFLWELVAICDECHERVHG